MPLQPGDDPNVVTEPTEPFLPDGFGEDAFAPDFDPDESSPEPFYTDPESSSPVSGSPGGNAVDSEDEAKADPLATLEFDEKYRQDFDGLLYLGKLTHEFHHYGHSFVVHTLTTDELLRAALLVKTWEGTLGQDRAYVTALAAASCDTVDGRPLYQSIGPGDDDVRGKFDYVRKNWHSWITDRVYDDLRSLESRVEEILARMGEASG